MAYCLDEAVIFFGMMLEAELDKAGHKPGKEERRAQRARERVLDQWLGSDQPEDAKKTGYADPALMFR